VETENTWKHIARVLVVLACDEWSFTTQDVQTNLDGTMLASIRTLLRIWRRLLSSCANGVTNMSLGEVLTRQSLIVETSVMPSNSNSCVDCFICMCVSYSYSHDKLTPAFTDYTDYHYIFFFIFIYCYTFSCK